MFRSSKLLGKEDDTTIVKNDLKRYKAVDIAIDGSYDDLMSQRGDSYFDDKINCTYIKVSYEKLCQLRDYCACILVYREKAPKLLPTVSGFFFGNTEYNELYFEQLVYTLSKLSIILDKYEDDTEFLYMPNW